MIIQSEKEPSLLDSRIEKFLEGIEVGFQTIQICLCGCLSWRKVTISLSFCLGVHQGNDR